MNNIKNKNASNYTDEFRKSIVEKIKSGTKPYEITKTYGIANATLARWTQKYNNSGSFRDADNLSDLEKKLKEEKALRLKAEMEADILKKALAIISAS